MSDRYDIYYQGELLEGHEEALVREKLRRLFNASDTVLDRLFSGEPQLVKSSCDNVTALKYQKAMKAAGARPLIRPVGGTAEPGPVSAVEEEPPAADTAQLESTAEETADFALAATGARLSEPGPEPPAAPNTDHLSTAAAGELIPNLPRFEELLDPDISGIDLAPEGTDLSDCAPPPVPDLEPDLSHLQLAEAGADVLEEKYRRHTEPPAPDTDHLELDPPA